MLPICSHNEFEILVRLKKGDVNAFQKIYFKYSPGIFGKLVKLTKSEEVAKDLLQNLFLKLWVTRESIDIGKSFRSYIFKIAENLAYDFFREAHRDIKQREELIFRAFLHNDIPEGIVVRNQMEKDLLEAIEELPPQRKLVFTLCKLQGKSYREVARLLDISTSTINDHIVRGNRFIYDRLKGSMVVTVFILCWFLSHI